MSYMYMYLEVVDPHGNVLVTGGLLVGQSHGLPHGIQKGGAATSEVGGACNNHLQTLNLMER